MHIRSIRELGNAMPREENAHRGDRSYDKLLIRPISGHRFICSEVDRKNCYVIHYWIDRTDAWKTIDTSTSGAIP
jgi:hypothetical protein